MRQYFKLLIVASITVLILGYNNCAPSNFEFEARPSSAGSPQPDDGRNDPGDDPTEDISQRCDNSTLQYQTVTVSFPNPQTTCPWNMNGNLGPRDSHFQGRIEQVVAFNLPTGSTLCDLDFQFPNQSFRFDDMFILTLNGVVLASSYNYSPRFQKANGLDLYSWDSIVGMPWNVPDEGIYCTGADQGLSQCSWPSTDTPGQIQMDFDQSIIRKIFSLDPSNQSHRFDLVSIGDNDNLDCEHSDITFTVRAGFVQ